VLAGASRCGLQLGERLRVRDADAKWDAGTTQHLGTNLSAEPVQAFDTGQICEGIIDAVNLRTLHTAIYCLQL
jgi:hypothetical protein